MLLFVTNRKAGEHSSVTSFPLHNGIVHLDYRVDHYNHYTCGRCAY